MTLLGVIIAAWLTPLAVATVVVVREARRPEPEPELERRLRDDREVGRLDAIWNAPAYTDVRLNEELDRLSRLAFEPADED